MNRLNFYNLRLHSRFNQSAGLWWESISNTGKLTGECIAGCGRGRTAMSTALCSHSMTGGCIITPAQLMVTHQPQSPTPGRNLSQKPQPTCYLSQHTNCSPHHTVCFSLFKLAESNNLPSCYPQETKLEVEVCVSVTRGRGEKLWLGIQDNCSPTMRIPDNYYFPELILLFLLLTTASEHLLGLNSSFCAVFSELVSSLLIPQISSNTDQSSGLAKLSCSKLTKTTN